jgi:undecaprenyl-diphosphatase
MRWVRSFFFGLGSYLLLREVRLWPTAGIIVTIAVAWCMVMSFSRLYLGVHFASDVAAGLIAGGAWVAVCVSGLELLQRPVVTPPRQARPELPGRAWHTDRG